MKKVNGSVSVFLALTVTIILSFCMVLIESARENTMLLKADVIFDTGVQCLLAEYHSQLWEEYDLLYVDGGYGMQLPDYKLVKAHLRGYIDNNLSYDNYGWLALDYIDAQFTDVSLATDYDGTDFYLQAVEAAKESVGVTYIEMLLDQLEQLDSMGCLESTMHHDISQVHQAIENVNGTEVEVKEAVWGVDDEGQPVLLEEAEYETVCIDNPLDDVDTGNLLLRQILDEEDFPSGVRMDMDGFVSQRPLAVGNAQEDREDTGGLWNKAFFCKYVMDHFSCYTDRADTIQSCSMQCLTEYMIGGKSSDVANLEVIVAKLLVIRELDNYMCLLQDEVRQAEAEAIGMGIATAAYVPWLSSVIKQALLLYWAYEESVEDLRVLFQGGSIPLVKSLHTETFSDLTLDYEAYLVLLLLLQQKEVLSMRAMDIIELDIREEQEHFRMDGCISRGTLTGTFTDTYDKTYTITKQLQY